jgi:cobalt-zinc-cadmium efflux system membrane fusion protein
MNALRTMTIMLTMAVAVAGCGKGAAQGESGHKDEHAGEQGEHAGEKGEHAGEKGEHAGEKGEHAGEKDEHGEEESGMVKLTPEQVASAKIAIAPVERRAVTSEIIATGEMVPPDDGIARIGAKASGRVTKLTKGVGDQVTRGQALATIDSPDLGRAKADYIAAASAATVTMRTPIARRRCSKKRSPPARLAIAEGEAPAPAPRRKPRSCDAYPDSDARFRTCAPTSTTHRRCPSLRRSCRRAAWWRGQMVEPQDTMFVVMDLRTVW